MVWVKKSILKYNTACCEKWLGKATIISKTVLGHRADDTKHPFLMQVSRSFLPDTFPSECLFGCVHRLSYTAVCIGEDIGINRKYTVKKPQNGQKINLHILGIHFAW